MENAHRAILSRIFRFMLLTFSAGMVVGLAANITYSILRGEQINLAWNGAAVLVFLLVLFCFSLRFEHRILPLTTDIDLKIVHHWEEDGSGGEEVQRVAV